MRALLLIVLVVPLWLQAQFAPPAELLFHIDDDHPQYELLLRVDANALNWIQASSDCVAELEIEVALTNTAGLMRHEARLLHAVSLPDSVCMNGPDSVLIVRRQLRWFPDLQQAAIRVVDRNGASVIDHTVELQPRKAGADLYISDLLLSDSLGTDMSSALPFQDYRLSADRLTLPYHISLFTERPRSLRLSVQLFLRGEANPGAPSQPYQSVFSEIEPLYLTSGTTHLSRVVPLEGLPSGDYLAEVYVFEEEEIVAEVSARFEKAWSGLRKIYADLPEAVGQLSPRLTQQQQQRLRSELSTRGQRAFDDYWATIADRYGEQPRRLVERYFQSVAALEQELQVPKPWQTDAGRVWLQYGQPDNTRRDTLDNRVYTTWQYDHYGMHFVFDHAHRQLMY